MKWKQYEWPCVLCRTYGRRTEERKLNLNQSIASIGLGLALRALVDVVTNTDDTVGAILVGLCEGFLLNFLIRSGDFIGSFVSYLIRVSLDYWLTDNVQRLIWVLSWTGVGALLSDVWPIMSYIIFKGTYRSYRNIRRWVLDLDDLLSDIPSTARYYSFSETSSGVSTSTPSQPTRRYPRRRSSRVFPGAFTDTSTIIEGAEGDYEESLRPAEGEGLASSTLVPPSSLFSGSSDPSLIGLEDRRALNYSPPPSSPSIIPHSMDVDVLGGANVSPPLQPTEWQMPSTIVLPAPPVTERVLGGQPPIDFPEPIVMPVPQIESGSGAGAAAESVLEQQAGTRELGEEGFDQEQEQEVEYTHGSDQLQTPLQGGEPVSLPPSPDSEDSLQTPSMSARGGTFKGQGVTHFATAQPLGTFDIPDPSDGDAHGPDQGEDVEARDEEPVIVNPTGDGSGEGEGDNDWEQVDSSLVTPAGEALGEEGQGKEERERSTGGPGKKSKKKRGNKK